jgi:hypothetical protein
MVHTGWQVFVKIESLTREDSAQIEARLTEKGEGRPGGSCSLAAAADFSLRYSPLED